VSIATLLAESTVPIHPPAAGQARGAPPGAILALDLGQRTGWAVSVPDGVITSGTVEFRPGRFEGGGMIFLRFKAWLKELDRSVGGIQRVYLEEVRAHRGTLAAQVHGGFLAHLTAWCEFHMIPYAGVPVATIKRHATGRGNASKGEVIAAMRAKGFRPADDNEADALALLLWAIARRGGGR
jgi:Holliday junction resolvasome RuvABC endonuclease subunit